MAVAREGKEISFQSAEAVLDRSKNNQALLIDAYSASEFGGGAPSPQAVSFDTDAALGGSIGARYIGEIPALGNDLVIGKPGLRSLHFELEAEVRRSNDVFDRFESNHTQGIKRFAPKIL